MTVFVRGWAQIKHCTREFGRFDQIHGRCTIAHDEDLCACAFKCSLKFKRNERLLLDNEDDTSAE